MLLVAFDLGGTAFVALDDEAGSEPVERHRGRKINRLSGHEFFGLAHIRRDVFSRLPRASGESRERERRAHKLEESPAPNWIIPLGSIFGKLAMQRFLELFTVGQLL